MPREEGVISGASFLPGQPLPKLGSPAGNFILTHTLQQGEIPCSLLSAALAGLNPWWKSQPPSSPCLEQLGFGRLSRWDVGFIPLVAFHPFSSKPAGDSLTSTHQTSSPAPCQTSHPRPHTHQSLTSSSDLPPEPAPASPGCGWWTHHY